MDLFGRKARRELESLHKAHEQLWKAWRDTDNKLQSREAVIRDYDGRLCAAMQQPTHEKIVEALRPLFLVAEARQRQHSDQLGVALIEDMNQRTDKYLHIPNTKALPNGL